MSELLKNQNLFSRDLAKLLEFCFCNGYEISLKEALRTPEQQEIYLKTGRSKTKNSYHLKSLAVDLAIYKNGVWLQEKKDLEPIGNYWESLNNVNKWGGHFSSFYDGMHFERRV